MTTRTYESNAQGGKPYVIGVDIGGTNTVVGVFSPGLQLLGKCTFLTCDSMHQAHPRGTDPNLFFDRLCAEIIRLTERTLARNEEGNPGYTVGVGVPGWVDGDRGMARSSSNLGWKEVPVAAELAKRLQAPVKIDNDVRLYTLGEVTFGAARGCASALGVIIGTGVAAAVYLHGRMVSGHHGYAGEIGHDAVVNHHVLCKCGRIGCMETIVSAPGIARLGKKDAVSLYDACMAGDEQACDAFRVAAETLGRKMLTCSMLIDPEVIIVGGGVAAAGELLLAPVRKMFEHQYRSGIAPAIKLGSLGDDAGIYGAARLAVSRHATVD